MDRNARKIRYVAPDVSSLSARRAWIEILYYGDDLTFSESLSARRAWIEIPRTSHDFRAPKVALRKESVDRNKYVVQCRKMLGVSLSARRAWIEISCSFY